MRDLVYHTQLHEPARQKPQRPATPLLRGIAAGQGYEKGLLLSVHLARLPRTVPLLEGPLEPLLHKLLPRALHRRAAQLQRRGDPLIGHSLVGQKQDVGATEFPSRRLAPANEIANLGALLLGQLDDIRLVHAAPSELGCGISQYSSVGATRHYYDDGPLADRGGFPSSWR